MAAIIGGIMEAEPKKHLWQFLDGKLTVLYSGTVSRLETQFLKVLMLIVAVVAVFHGQMHGNVLKWVG